MKKVLIVEDDRILLSRLTTILENLKDIFEVIPVGDGQEAISILKQQPISLVVTDIQMPRVGGLALLAHINKYHPNIPCFVMTAYGTSRLKAKLPKGILRFFQKPFDIHDFAKAIIVALNRDVDRKFQKGISLFDFMYMIEIDQASCMLKIESSDKTTGVLYFENGVLHDAECGELTGETAALELLSSETPTYLLKFSSQKEIVRRIKTDLRDLIRNVAGSIDEIPQGT